MLQQLTRTRALRCCTLFSINPDTQTFCLPFSRTCSLHQNSKTIITVMTVAIIINHYISHMCARVLAKFCMTRYMADVMCRFRVFINYEVKRKWGGVEIWHLPLKWLVTLTTMLHYNNNSSIQHHLLQLTYRS